MEFTSSDQKFSISIQQAIVIELERICTDAVSKETGGVLIGHYSENLNTALITSITGPPPDSRAGKTWFHRGIEGLRDIFQQCSNTYYVGEWHFHPFASPTPSLQDLRQMKRIALDKQYNCPEPILIILGGKMGHFNIRSFVFPNGICIEMF